MYLFYDYKLMSIPDWPLQVNIFEMKNLKLIELDDQNSFIWLNLTNLPSLEKVIISGNVKRIIISSAEQLTFVDLNGCIELEELIVSEAPKLAVLKIDGCRSLGHVGGFDEKSKTQLSIQTQIEAAQTQSRNDGSIYPSMTAKDFYDVLERINSGVRFAKEIGLYVDVDYLEDSEADSFPIQFSIALSPHGFLDSTGTGETFIYKFVAFTDSNDPSVWRSEIHSAGLWNREDGLTTALDWLCSTECLSIPDGAGTEQSRVLSLLNRLHEMTKLAAVLPLAQSPGIKGGVGQLVETALRIGNDPSMRGLSHLQNSVWWNYSSLWQRLGERHYCDVVLAELSSEAIRQLKEKVAPLANHVPQKATTVHPVQMQPSEQQFHSELQTITIGEKTIRTKSEFEEMATSGNLSFRLAAALSTDAPKKVLELLSKDKNAIVRCRVAENDSAPLPILDQLACDKDAFVRSNVANSARVSKGILERLSTDKNVNVRSAVALNERTPKHVLGMMSKDSSIAVVSAVASNPTLATPVRIALSKHKSVKVRRAVAKCSVLPVEVLTDLAGDKDEIVRMHVASDCNSPREILETLSKDIGVEVRKMVAMNPTASPTLLKVLSLDKSEAIRIGVASNSSTSRTLLSQLAVDKSSNVRCSVAVNANTPRIALLRLSLDSDGGVNYRAAKALEQITQGESESNDSEALAVDSDIFTKLHIASAPLASTSDLSRLASSETEAWFVRAVALSNPAFPKELRTEAKAALEKSVLHALSDQVQEELQFSPMSEEEFENLIRILAKVLERTNKLEMRRYILSSDGSERACTVCTESVARGLLKLMLSDTDQVVRSIAAVRMAHDEYEVHL